MQKQSSKNIAMQNKGKKQGSKKWVSTSKLLQCIDKMIKSNELIKSGINMETINDSGKKTWSKAMPSSGVKTNSYLCKKNL